MSHSPDQIDALLNTPLHTLHLELGAKMVPFAGYAMPVQYKGIMEEHRHTRDQASLFDVSHMGQVKLSGTEAAHALESLDEAEGENEGEDENEGDREGGGGESGDGDCSPQAGRRRPIGRRRG